MLRRPWALAVGALLVVAFALRVWGVDHGLPYAYNIDENTHFVPKAIGLFGHGLNPHYFVNPPAFTYVLHVVFAVWFGGREGVSASYAADPTEVFVVARITGAVLGTVAVWLLYLAGARLFDRRVGLLAAGGLAVAFLPVFYAHLALNDVPTLAPVCLCLWGVAGIVRLGRTRDYAVAGVALGLAAATKYTGGIVLLPLLGAALVAAAGPGGRRAAARGAALSGVLALVAFVAANPYAVLAFDEFADGLAHQNDAAGDAAGKIGLTRDSGIGYYLWTLTWGLGWVPMLLAVGALAHLGRREPRLLWVLAPAPVAFLVFMGLQERFFGRWVMPILPGLCLLAAVGALALADRLGRHRPRLRPMLAAGAAVAVCGQGAVAALHSGRVLSRDDTRNQARAWMVANLPPTRLLRDPPPGARVPATRVVVEPVVPDGWVQDIGRPSPLTANGNRWAKFPTSRTRFDEAGRPLPAPGRVVGIEDYVRFLRPGLIDEYLAGAYCWVVTGSTQRGRVDVDPAVVPRAAAYYAALERRGRLVHESSPFASGADPVAFNFDFSFNYAPLAYERPGPVMRVYRLRGGRCAS